MSVDQLIWGLKLATDRSPGMSRLTRSGSCAECGDDQPRGGLVVLYRRALCKGCARIELAADEQEREIERQPW